MLTRLRLGQPFIIDNRPHPAGIRRHPRQREQRIRLRRGLRASAKLGAFRHEGLWLTINTPKDLRRAEEYVGAHPEWLQA